MSDTALDNLMDRLGGIIVDHSDTCDLWHPGTSKAIRMILNKLDVVLSDAEFDKAMLAMRKRHRFGMAAELARNSPTATRA